MSPEENLPPSRTAAASSNTRVLAVVQDDRSWKRTVALHDEPVLRRSVWQLVNTLIPYLMLWGGMLWAVNVSYWLVLPMAVVAAGFLVRIFIVFHDCVHGSFLPSRKANTVVGFLTGVLTFTPFGQWRREHLIHHGSSGDLDRRGTGDVWTLTVKEYLASTRWRRLSYRFVRSPFVLFFVAPFCLFVFWNRLPSLRLPGSDRWSVHFTNIALVALITLLGLTIGFRSYLLIQLPIMFIAASAGVWLFYVQHQFEGAYWERKPEWNYVDAALKGSSFYRLPKVLQWFSGNIGFHHLHHLSPAIPNYNLERCHEADPRFREVKAITLRTSLKSLSWRLWDEQHRTLIGFRALRAIRRKGTVSGC